MVTLDSSGSSDWVWALINVEPRVFAGGLDASMEKKGPKGALQGFS